MAEHDSDFFAVVQRINGTGSPDDVAAAYHAHLRDLYWKGHDLPGVIAIGRAGILYCLAHSLRSQAKAIAYDVGSFTWPGWEEPGIDPTVDDLAFGRQCAELNLRLALQLNKPDEKVAAGHWLIGAHALTAGDWSLAILAFEAAMLLVDADSPWGIYVQSCAAVAATRTGENSVAAQAAIDVAMKKLKASDHADAATYVGQLESIRKLHGVPV